MKHPLKKAAAFLLAAALLVQGLPLTAFAAGTSQGFSPGKELFVGEEGQMRQYISETAYDLAPGVTEYITYTNVPDGTNQNIDYFCEVDLSKAKMMVGYSGMEGILENQTLNWRMQTVSDQVEETQAYFRSSEEYKDSTIVAALNADYYNMATGQPTGALIIDGHSYNPVNGRYYFGITEKGQAVISNSEDTAGLAYAVGGGTLLVKDGEVNVSKGGRNVTYTAIGIKADGTVVSMVCYGQRYPVSCGYTQYEVAQMMKARGCQTALLLDGSGSSTFVSRREGDNQTITRNDPSDGQERQVSSSIFIISDVKATGEFDHAVVSPVNEVYTPGSTVQFTAVGADPSGAPASLPENASWSVDSDYGSIDGSTGVFTSNGSLGEVTVSLQSAGKTVGEATITIAAPDQLLFSSEKVNVGFGDTSDLGLQVRYQGRNVNYKDGDFQWTLSDEKMGSFSGNLFQASETESITGTATVTSVHDQAVTATVQLEVGKEPIIAMDFEEPNWKIVTGTTQHGLGDVVGVFDENGNYTTDAAAVSAATQDADAYCLSYTNRNGPTQPKVGNAKIVSLAEGAPVHSGSYSMRMDYDFTQNNNQTDGVCFGLSEDLVLEGNPNKIGLWVYIPEGTPSLWLRLRYTDGAGASSQIDFTKEDLNDETGLHKQADNAWHYYEANLENLITPVKIPAGMSIRLMVLSYATSGVGWTSADGTKIDKSECYGSLYFDDLTFIYGSTNQDVVPPEITNVTVNESPLTDGQTFDINTLAFSADFQDSTESSLFNTGINFDNVLLYVDGLRIEEGAEGAFVDHSGIIRADKLVLSQGQHTIRLLVTDIAGNQTSQSYNINITDPQAPEAPVSVTAREGTAVLGQGIHLDFTPVSADVTSLEASVFINKTYKDSFALSVPAGCTIVEEARYDSVTSTVSFKVEGSVSSGPMATLAFTVPSSVVPGTTFSGRLTKGVVTFASAQEGLLPTFGGPVVEIPVSAPYTVSSGTLVAGLDDSFVFTITDSSTGSPAPGVDLYLADGKKIGTSDRNGQVRYVPGSGVVSLTVYAQDGENNVSGSYQATVYTPQGREDGAPTHVWRNASDDADSLNVSWLSNPLYADSEALLQLAEEEEAVEAAEPISGTCQLTGFSDNAAANACGVTAEGLAPGTTYYYRVGDGEHWSEVRSFTTGYENTGIQALVLGDLQESNNQNLSGILEQVGVEGLDLTVQTGDLVDSGGNYAYWDSTLSMLEKLDTDRFFSLGNHELEGGLPIGTLLYHQENPDYTSAEYGNVYFASIAINGGTAGYEKALEWLVADAQASHASWKILVTHQPAYYTNAVAGMDASTQQAVAQAVQEAGIDVVLSGHDHSYARTEPLYNGEVDQEKGITYFICGSLGEKSYSVTDNPEFHFAQATNDYQALYILLSTTADTLRIQAYDYNNGSPALVDSFTKTKDNGGHVHDYTWDGQSRLTCEGCGYTMSSSRYTGYARFTTPEGKSGQVYLNAGNRMTGVFAVGDEVLHAGEDGLLHESETVNTAQCWEDGFLGCWCHEENEFYQLSETRRQGHVYNENHVCTRQVFDMNTFTYRTCGFQGKNIQDMDISLSYLYGFYTGSEKRPAVTVTDPETGKKYFGQSTYGDYMPYWENNVNVGTARVVLEGYSDGPIYGTTTLTFDIVPTNVTEEDFSCTTTANSARLSWKPSLGATHYIVYQNIGGTWTRLGIVGKPEYTVTGLGQGSYQFRIRPFATVDGKDYYSTKNSDIVTVEVEGGPLSFEQGGTVECTYGDEPFTNAAVMDDSTEGFAYSSSDETVATVDANTGEVTIVGAGSAVITAKKDGVTGQYRLTVSPITVDLEWRGTGERVYDGQPSNVTATAIGLLEGDAAQVTVTGGTEKDAGSYTAEAASLDNKNYALPEGASVSYTITPKPITNLTWSDLDLTYTGQPQAPTASSEEVVAGDTVEFSVPTVTEPGTYEVAAASKNPNYVVADSAKTCTFTIAYPQVKLNGGEGADLTYSFDGMTILVSGFVPTKSQPVTLELTGNGQSTSAKIYGEEAVSTITLSGVTYTVDVNVTATSVKREDGATQASISAELTEEVKADVQDAAKSENNRFVDIWGSIAGSFLDKVIREAQEFQEKVEEVGESLYVEIYQKLDVVEYDPGAENPIYKVDITPYYDIYVLEEGQMKPADGAKPILGNALDNEQFQEKVPVQVSLVVPAGLTLDENTYILHEDGTYIKPDNFDAKAHTLTFTTPHFSQFTVVNDTRQATIDFTSEEGTVTCIYTPAEIGKELPKSEYGWTIHGKRYTTFEEELFQLADGESALRAEPSDPPVNPGGGGTPSEPEEPTWPFEDVTEGEDWFYDAVAYVYENGIMAGTSETTFEPGMLLDRAMAAQLFYNLEGKPAVTGDSTFTDVTSAHWAVDAITWAAQNDIVAGIGGGLYDPDSNVTREQFAVMLYKYARFKGYDLTVSGDLTQFPDDGSISSWAETALSWANGKGLINGNEDGTLAPGGTATRAQAASILANFDQNVAK